MKILTLLSTFIALCAISTGCSNITTNENLSKNSPSGKNLKQNSTHQFGGWYCPDNLTNFPAVNIKEWSSITVIKDRLPTKEETQDGRSLIYIDSNEYPNSKPFDIGNPRLAKIYCQQTRREETIIIIQSILIENDTIVGFRYLNGGNGSAKFNHVTLLSNQEIENIPLSKFFTTTIEIVATPASIWEVLTLPSHLNNLSPLLDSESNQWRGESNVNFYYPNAGDKIAVFGDKLYGNYYIQNDYSENNYTEKFFLHRNEKDDATLLEIVCGPFINDYEQQENRIRNWAKKLKELSESIN